MFIILFIVGLILAASHVNAEDQSIQAESKYNITVVHVKNVNIFIASRGY